MCLAIPGRVSEIFENHGALMGKVNFGGITKTVCLEYVPDIAVGDYTIVHVGFALNKIDEESAKISLKLFQELGVIEEEIGPDEGATHEVHE
jgi:hydrogenase expression/formation protein HypC